MAVCYMKKVLVVQFTSGVAQEHAQRCFIDSCPDTTFAFVHGVESDCSQIDLADISHIIIGGSGAFYLSQGDGATTWLPSIFSLLNNAFEKDIPILGICFGFQILALHQGARVVHNADAEEIGTFLTYSYPAAANDKLFSVLPQQFFSQLIHKDVIEAPPSSIERLSYSDRVQCNGFKVAGRSAWGVLFHPELTAQTARERLSMFPEYIQAETGSVDQFIQSHIIESPETSKLLRVFCHI
jgi:GMP synthase (glutamine-hydrolysing)